MNHCSYVESPYSISDEHASFAHGERVTKLAATPEEIEKALADKEPYYIPLTYQTSSMGGVGYVEMSGAESNIPWTPSDGKHVLLRFSVCSKVCRS